MLEKLFKKESFTKLSPKIQQAIRKYAKPCIGINASIAKAPLPLTASKFGGVPFIPSREDVPRDDKGRPYLMLVQLNFDEIREKVGQHPELPESGILQLYIQGFSTRFFAHAVTYYKNIENLNIDEVKTEEYQEFFQGACEINREDIKLTQEGFNYSERDEKLLATPFAQKYECLPEFPLYDECALQLKAEIAMPVSEDIDIPTEEREKLWEILGDEKHSCLNSSYHRLVGFLSGCSHDDPRVEYYIDEPIPEELEPLAVYDTVYRKDLHLFLEIFSQYTDEPINKYGGTRPLIMLADVGEAHFFIKQEDLKNKDFNQMRFSMEGG